MAAGSDRSAKRSATPSASGRPALVAYVTAGFPDARDFRRSSCTAVARAADVVEIGVPFTDPMADGTTIQRSSRAALAAGRVAAWILPSSPARRPQAARAIAADELSQSVARVRSRRVAGGRGARRRLRLHRARSAVRGMRRSAQRAGCARSRARAVRHAGDADRAHADAVRRRAAASSTRSR